MARTTVSIENRSASSSFPCDVGRARRGGRRWRIDHPDLSKVDEVGFADLMPGSGHGPGGYVNVGRIEVYGKPVKR